MGKEKGFSGGFLIITGILVTGIATYFYMHENRFIETSAPVTARIAEIRNEPRRRVLQIYTANERISDTVFSLTVPFWDTRQAGEQISVRIGPETPPQVKVNEFMYLHKISMGFFAGLSILFGILSGVLFFRRRG